MEKDAYCQELSRYIHLNPARAGLMNTLSAYRWSSYPSYIGSRKGPSWLTADFILGYFGRDEPSARESYRQFVEGVLDKESRNPLKDVFASTILGTPEFISWVREKVIEVEDPDIRNVPALRGLVPRPSLEEIGRTVELVIRKEHPLYKRFCLFVSQYHGGHHEVCPNLQHEGRSPGGDVRGIMIAQVFPVGSHKGPLLRKAFSLSWSRFPGNMKI